ncbi:hypothetical protein E2C01_075472 [Portunus trituberculatus]|uniref:Uncharacterized protein n=1 Tax=Portunus trituberculatus TaxID=210409 RepID=A0A5B7IFW3_PORTR|nr:hypothetical protein [Portunus trituberculatus]
MFPQTHLVGKRCQGLPVCRPPSPRPAPAHITRSCIPGNVTVLRTPNEGGIEWEENKGDMWVLGTGERGTLRLVTLLR